MAEDSEGGIWLASNDGVYREFRGKLAKLADGHAYWGIVRVGADVFLANVAKSANPDLADFNSDLIRVSKAQGGWRAETLIKRATVARLKADAAGNVLYRCPGGYCELRAEDIRNWRSGLTVAVVQHAFPLGNLTGPLGEVSRDSFGCIWLRTGFEAGYQCADDPHPVRLPRSVSTRGSPQIWQLPDGPMVIPSMTALALGRPGKWRVITAADGFPGTGDGYSLVTGDGNIWISNSNGLFVLPTHLNMEFWTEQDGLDGATWSVLPFGEKVFAVAGNTVRVLAHDRKHWTRLAEFSGATHLLAIAGNTILVGGTAGIEQIGLNGATLRKSAPLFTRTLAQTSDGQIWASGNQVFRVNLDGNRISFHTDDEPPPRRDAPDINADRSGGLWACYTAGLARRDGLGWHVLSTSNGLLENACRSFAVDSQGDVWYSYRDVSAFSWIQNPTSGKPQIHHFLGGGETGLASNNFFVFDSRGWLWRGTEDGLYVADLEQARQGRWLYFNRTDGLPGTDSNSRSFVEDRDGSIWFGESTAIVHLYPPHDLVRPMQAPSLFLSGFSWNGSSFQMADMVGPLKSGSNVTAHVGSMQVDRRNALRIRYRVLPEQPSWRETKNLDLALGVLAAGEHTVEVQGRVFTGPWSRTARAGLLVLRPVWMTGPYLLTYLVALFVVGTTFEFLRRRRALDERLLMPDIGELRMAALLPEGDELTGLLLDGRFEVGKVLARGGFATVLAGYDRRQKQRCAIKVFRGEVTSSAPVLHGVAQEVRALRQIRHESVVAIYADGVTKAGAPYVAMEFIEGKNLRDILRDGPLTEARTGQVLAQLASALDAIHGYGICHRDVKPENVIVRAGDGVAVLIDFSIAIIKDVNETMHGISRAAGTFDYMAPEQALGYAEPASDVFSLAKLVLELLCGKKVSEMAPNAGLDLPQKVPALLKAQGLELSEESMEMLARALEFDPKNRPRAASEFARPIISDLRG